MRRTVAHRNADDGRLLLEEQTFVFRLSEDAARRPADLGVSAGTDVRVELLDDSGHLLDSMTYVVADPR